MERVFLTTSVCSPGGCLTWPRPVKGIWGSLWNAMTPEVPYPDTLNVLTGNPSLSKMTFSMPKIHIQIEGAI